MLINHNTQYSCRTANAQSLFGQLNDFWISAGQISFVCVVGNKMRGILSLV